MDKNGAPAKSIAVKEGYEKGDVNHDGQVDEQDIQLVIDYIMTGIAGGFDLNDAKMNGDDKVDAADLVLMINRAK